MKVPRRNTSVASSTNGPVLQILHLFPALPLTDVNRPSSWYSVINEPQVFVFT
jgi:hypothetical protein